MRLTRVADSSGVELEGVNLADPLLYADGDPHTIWHAMRERSPVHWQPVGGHGFWSITRYDDALRVLRDCSAFTSEEGTLLNLLGAGDPAGGHQMVATDPPRHGELRAPIQKALAHQAVGRYAAGIRAEVAGFCATAVSGEPFNLAEAAMRLAAGVGGRVLGLDPADLPRLCRLQLMAVAPDHPGAMLPEGPEATLRQAHHELLAYLDDVVRRRRRDPRDDLVGLLLNAQVDGRPMTRGAIISNCYSLLLGAGATTPFLIGATLLELTESGLYAYWARHPELIPSGTDEALRWTTPGNHVMRHAREDVTLRGRTIRRGDAVVVWFGSANRDAEVFAAPYAFDLARRPNRHLSFGFGPHYCVGHAVARMTLHTLLAELFRTCAGFELTGPVQHLPSNFIAGLADLPVRGIARAGVRAGPPKLLPA
jgi:cytochrome P450